MATEEEGAMSIGLQLQEARESAGLSLREVCRRTGEPGNPERVSPAALSRIENGLRYPSLRTLEALAKTLRVQVSVGPDRVTVKRRKR
jgi:transcriptional regulator with XRE-family HTH domain